MNSRRMIPAIAGSALLLAGTVAGIAGSGALGAHAASSVTTAKAAAPPTRPGLMGTLVSASGTTLKMTVMPARKSATVHLTSKTTYVVNGKTTKTHPTWKKGEQIGVTETRAKNGTYTVTSVSVGMPAGGPGGPGGPGPGGTPPVTGSVVSSASAKLVVKTSAGKTTFTLTSRTQYMVNGMRTKSRPAFKAGETVHVMATKSGSTETAQLVFIGSMPAPPAGGPPPSGSGG